ncbi:helix-turn-helix transcriptional regulator [Desemzia incerta]|uniref:helix-turn-helix transcriptional regulator n=1 Tax=Desemzia incerta TaxID=82801 RepID=UPI001660E95E|nr:helix-turn-helix domain-containing protein [Desemzia incerta]
MSRDTVKGYRILTGYTQQDLADLFGITKQAVSQKERGVTRFSEKEMIVIRDLVREVIPNATIDDIFFNKKVNKSKKEV